MHQGFQSAAKNPVNEEELHFLRGRTEDPMILIERPCGGNCVIRLNDETDAAGSYLFYTLTYISRIKYRYGIIKIILMTVI